MRAKATAEKVELLLQAKDDYLRLVVHELRGPLGHIAGYLSLIGAGDLGRVPDAVRHAGESASLDARRMIGLIDRLASIACLEDHTLLLTPSPCKVSDVLRAAIEGAQVEASAKHICLELRVAEPDLEVTGDADQLRTA